MNPYETCGSCRIHIYNDYKLVACILLSYQSSSPNYKMGLCLYPPTNERSPNYKWGLSSLLFPPIKLNELSVPINATIFYCASPPPYLHYHHYHSLPISSLPPELPEPFLVLNGWGPLSPSQSVSVPPTCQMKKGQPKI